MGVGRECAAPAAAPLPCLSEVGRGHDADEPQEQQAKEGWQLPCIALGPQPHRGLCGPAASLLGQGSRLRSIKVFWQRCRAGEQAFGEFPLPPCCQTTAEQLGSTGERTQQPTQEEAFLARPERASSLAPLAPLALAAAGRRRILQEHGREKGAGHTAAACAAAAQRGVSQPGEPLQEKILTLPVAWRSCEEAAGQGSRQGASKAPYLATRSDGGPARPVCPVCPLPASLLQCPGAMQRSQHLPRHRPAGLSVPPPSPPSSAADLLQVPEDGVCVAGRPLHRQGVGRLGDALHPVRLVQAAGRGGQGVEAQA